MRDPVLINLMAEQPSPYPSSLDQVLSMARRRSREKAKDIELTPEEKEHLSELIDQAKQAEKAIPGEKDEEIRKELYRQAITLYTQVKEDLAAIREKRKKEAKVPESIKEMVESAKEKLSKALNTRFKEFDSTHTFEFSNPENIPENLTPEHIEVINEVFGQNTESTLIPKPKELHNLDDEYQRVMYPETQQESDKKNGLVSYRPAYFNQSAKEVTKQEETWLEAYTRSMNEEMETLGGSLVLYETTQKPNYKDGKQHYGTKEGDDPSKDPLLPIFKQAFGKDANRFNHSWDDIQTKLIPKVKEHITKQFQDKNLPIPDFDVILAPASLFNLQTTLNQLNNSQTNTFECSSTVLTGKDKKDSGHRLRVGGSGRGGSSNVDYDHRGSYWDGGGARLAVVLRKHTDT